MRSRQRRRYRRSADFSVRVGGLNVGNDLRACGLLLLLPLVVVSVFVVVSGGGGVDYGGRD